MKQSNLAEEAYSDPKAFYDERYRAGYMQGFDIDVYEACRVKTVREMLSRLEKQGLSPKSVLDYGCGEGRYIGELQRIFPRAKLAGSDISETGLEIAATHYPSATFIPMGDERIAAEDASFDLVISVEVLEHVQDARTAAMEISRVLKPGGVALITTPCANRYSFEWFSMALSGGLEPTRDGYGRFRLDEPGHLRRLNDRHMRDLFRGVGIEIGKIYHRAHIITPLVETRIGRRLLPYGLRKRLAMLDWHLFKHLPNGSTLLAIGRKL